MGTSRYRLDGHEVLAHRLSVPLDHADPAGEQIELFAREVIRDGRQARPHLVYFQGGPGHRADRPATITGWLDRALEDFRVVLVDQRGTGLSAPADELTLTGDATEQARYLSHFRADAIVADAELLRSHLTGGAPWATLGQSFGGFVVTRYLSSAPGGLREAFITGGLPSLTADAEEVYRLTYRQTAHRNAEYFARYRDDAATVRELAQHLAGTEELLPTGERLSPRRLRQLGIHLGAQLGFDALHYLLEDPFVTVGGTRRLARSFLAEVGSVVSFVGRPLYAMLQESIYAQGSPTRWAAHRVRREFDVFAQDGDPADTQVPYYLTGEHVYPWQLTEDPALRPLAGAAELLAQTTFPPLYEPAALAANEVPVAAAIYLDDMFVPYELSAATARSIRGLRAYVTNTYQHDGIRADGAAILDHLMRQVRR